MPPVDPLDIERRAVEAATRVLRDRIELVSARALAVYDALPDELKAGSAAKIAQVVSLIADEDVVTQAIRDAVNEATKAGVKDAEDRLRISHKQLVLPSMRAIKATMSADKAVKEEVGKAAALARAATSSGDLQAALAVARRAVSRTEAAARFAVNAALTDATSTVNEAHGALDLWVAERDACLHCLAHQGHMVPAGTDFPNVTFSHAPLKGGNPRPPLHPNCRCRIIPHLPEWGTDYPDALKREAQRSVLRGWSLPSESEKARLSAAERLLARGSNLPKSVQDYAHRAIKKGAFPKGRTHPELPTHPDDKIELKPGKKIAVPKPPDKVKGSAFDALPRKEPGSITEGFARYIKSVHGWSTGDDEMDSDIRAVNPNFHEARQWQVNCQRVAVAYELRRRGYDVEALGNDKRPGTKQYTRSDLALLWEKFWMNPAGERAGANSPGAVEARRTWQYVIQASGGGAARLDKMNETIDSWPPGARGWITNVWNGGLAGHIWNVEKRLDGSVVWLDAQPGKVLNATEIKQYVTDSQTIHMMRVDDLTLSEEAVTMVRGR